MNQISTHSIAMNYIHHILRFFRDFSLYDKVKSFFSRIPHNLDFSKPEQPTNNFDNDLFLQYCVQYNCPSEIIDKTLRLNIKKCDNNYQLWFDYPHCEENNWTTPIHEIDDYYTPTFVSYIKDAISQGIIYIDYFDYIEKILTHEGFIEQFRLNHPTNTFRRYYFQNTYTEVFFMIEKHDISNDNLKVAVNMDAIFPELYQSIEERCVGQTVKSACE